MEYTINTLQLTELTETEMLIIDGGGKFWKKVGNFFKKPFTIGFVVGVGVWVLAA